MKWLSCVWEFQYRAGRQDWWDGTHGIVAEKKSDQPTSPKNEMDEESAAFPVAVYSPHFPSERKIKKNVHNELCFCLMISSWCVLYCCCACMWWEKSDINLTCGIRRRSLSLCPFLVGRVTSITYGCCCCCVTPDERHIHIPRPALTEIELLALSNEMSLLLLFSLVKTFVGME